MPPRPPHQPSQSAAAQPCCCSLAHLIGAFQNAVHPQVSHVPLYGVLLQVPAWAGGPGSERLQPQARAHLRGLQYSSSATSLRDGSARHAPPQQPSPVASQQLQRVIGHGVAGVGGKALGHGALQGGGGGAGIQGGGGVAHHQARGLRGRQRGVGSAGGLIGSLQPGRLCQGPPGLRRRRRQAAEGGPQTGLLCGCPCRCRIRPRPAHTTSVPCPPCLPCPLAWMEVAMSATLNWVAWKAEMGPPNCCRARVYSRAVSRQNCAPPTLRAPRQDRRTWQSAGSEDLPRSIRTKRTRRSQPVLLPTFRQPFEKAQPGPCQRLAARRTCRRQC